MHVLPGLDIMFRRAVTTISAIIEEEYSGHRDNSTVRYAQWWTGNDAALHVDAFLGKNRAWSEQECQVRRLGRSAKTADGVFSI